MRFDDAVVLVVLVGRDGDAARLRLLADGDRHAQHAIAVRGADAFGVDALTEVELPTSGRISLLVGPEGGISPRELDLLEQQGSTRVRLGSEILRTSTAGPAAIAVLNARLGRW